MLEMNSKQIFSECNFTYENKKIENFFCNTKLIHTYILKQ
jgi:hypothetical protein